MVISAIDDEEEEGMPTSWSSSPNGISGK